MIGETIGNFKIVAKLGRGGMGEVFAAEHQKIGTKVAIKMLLPDLSMHKDHVDRFFNEALAVNKIKHAGIVKIFDVGFYDKTGSAYLVMELLEGESLATRISRSGRLTLGQIAEIGRQIASVLDATHAEGITHRDLKPDNIFLIRDAELASKERVKILDFGIAKLTGTLAKSGPKTVGAMGTPAYMAPEQWGDSSKVDWRADAYALGCVAFEMAAGRTPFIAETFPEAFAKHLTEPPPLVRTLSATLPQDLERLIDQLLAKKPEGRPPSMGEVARRFEAAGKGQPGIVDATMLPEIAERPAVVTTPPLGFEGSGGTVAPTLAPNVATVFPGTQPPAVEATQPPIVAAAKPAVAATAREAVAPRSIAELPPSRAPLWIAIAGVAVVGGGVAAYVATRGSSGSAPAAVPPPALAEPTAPPSPSPTETPMTAPSPQQALRKRIETVNPFINAMQVHQVTDRELRWYLASLPESERAAASPVAEWTATAPAGDAPIAWMTFERARAFCKAIGASLPSQERWVAGSSGRWGVDPAGTGTLGPLEEWTSTTHDGLAIVMGGHAKMDAADKKLAIEAPLYKATEALAGADAAPKLVASAVIGFRCAQ